MRRHVLFVLFVLVVNVAVPAGAAGKSDVADAAMRNDLNAVRALIGQKADVNAAQPDGATALHWAAYRGNTEMAGLLLRAGANPKAPNRQGATPLWLASGWAEERGARAAFLHIPRRIALADAVAAVDRVVEGLG